MIIPGILTDDKNDLMEKVGQAASFGERVSVDVIDGVFANNLTVLPEALGDIDWIDLAVDVQLMVESPVHYLETLNELGVQRVFGHVEMMDDVEVFLQRASELGLLGCLGVDLPTEIHAIRDHLNEVSGILLMSVQAGRSGQAFQEKALDKARWLRERGYEGDIVMDGGMDSETIPQALEAGANQFSVTSAIWQSDEPRLSYERLVGILNA